MQITKQTDTRLVLQQQTNEKRVVAVLGAYGFLAIGIFFYFMGGDDGRLFAYLFLGCGVIFAGLIFMPNAAETLILDTDEGMLILRVPNGTKRRVITVPFDQIAGVSLNERGNRQHGFYSQVDFDMTQQSGKRPLRLPVAFSGMSHELMHETIVRWAKRNGAFPTEPEPDSPPD